MWSCQKMRDALQYLFGNIVRFGLNLYRQIVGKVFQLALVVLLLLQIFCFCFEKYFVLSLSEN